MAELLWECGCTVTIQMHVVPDSAKWLRTRHLGSEGIKALGHPNMSDTFVSFARLVKSLNITKVQEGKDNKLRWSNSPYNDAMHKSIMALLSILDTKVESALLDLDFHFGREVLSNQYSKLQRLANFAKSNATSSMPASDLMAWMIRMLHVAFQCKLQVPRGASETWLDRDRKAAMPGFWPACVIVLEAWSVQLRETCEIRMSFESMLLSVH